jgi:hypothetical protein
MRRLMELMSAGTGISVQGAQLTWPGRFDAGERAGGRSLVPPWLISSTARNTVPLKSPQRWTANSQAPSASCAS